MEMLDGDHYMTAQLVEQLISNAQIKATYDLIAALNPEITKLKNDQGDTCYCIDYKGVIISGGETLYQAMCNFQSDFFNKRAIL